LYQCKSAICNGFCEELVTPIGGRNGGAGSVVWVGSCERAKLGEIPRSPKTSIATHAGLTRCDVPKTALTCFNMPSSLCMLLLILHSVRTSALRFTSSASVDSNSPVFQ
jgi:hypothetical protein